MADKAADSTLAPRLSYVEDLAAWFKDNRGEGGCADRSDLLKRLWTQKMFGSSSSGNWYPDPWNHTDSVHRGLPNPIPCTRRCLETIHRAFCLDETSICRRHGHTEQPGGPPSESSRQRLAT